MRIAIIGTGYVGLVSGACLSEFGHEVICIDKDAGKVETLRAGTLASSSRWFPTRLSVWRDVEAAQELAAREVERAQANRVFHIVRGRQGDGGDRRPAQGAAGRRIRMNGDLHPRGPEKVCQREHQTHRMVIGGLARGVVGPLEPARGDPDAAPGVRRETDGRAHLQGDAQRARGQMPQWVGKGPDVEGPTHVDATRRGGGHRPGAAGSLLKRGAGPCGA